MNWRLTGSAKEIAKAELVVEHAEHEDASIKPDKALVTYARKAAAEIAAKLGGETQIEAHGHETTSGRGFRPAHLVLSVSKLDPKRAAD